MNKQFIRKKNNCIFITSNNIITNINYFEYYYYNYFTATIQNQNDEEISFMKESALKNEEIVKNEVKMDQGLHFLNIKINKFINSITENKINCKDHELNYLDFLYNKILINL